MDELLWLQTEDFTQFLDEHEVASPKNICCQESTTVWTLRSVVGEVLLPIRSLSTFEFPGGSFSRTWHGCSAMVILVSDVVPAALESEGHLDDK
jgi:hypothetical protein